MRTFRFTPDAGHPIAAFGSRGVTLSPVQRTEALNIVAMYLEPGGVIARHPAAGAQLFLVVEGSGTVTGADRSDVVPVGSGTAIVWEPGEEHETRAGSGGLRAIVLEGPAVADG